MDIVQIATQQAAFHTAWAPAAAFAAGVGTCFGPCVAPRFIAVTGIVGGSRGPQRWLRIGAFVAGLCASYVAIGLVASLLSRVAAWSSLVYVAMAVLLGAFGIRTVFSNPGATCEDHDHHRTDARSSLGAAALLGASFAFVLSPCCTPVIAALAGIAGTVGNLGFGALMLGAFAAGHALPLLAVGAGAASIERAMARYALAGPIATVSGALMIALAGYYALLA